MNDKEHKQETLLPDPLIDDSNTEMMVLSTAVLISGQPYQRPVEEKTVNHILRHWDARVWDPLVVSYRDGKFYLVDGQHRVSVLRQRNGGKDLDVRCKVFYGLDYEGEAELCYKLDKAKNRLSLSESTKMLIESGTDPRVMEIQKLLERNGFVWALTQKTGSDYEITASRAVISAYNLLGVSGFDRLLRLLYHTWHGVPTSLKSSIISGMALFLKTYETELRDADFVERMSHVDPEEINRRGKLDFSTNKMAKRYARAILEKYNGQRGKRKLVYRLG